jgi:hypothetical protein
MLRPAAVFAVCVSCPIILHASLRCTLYYDLGLYTEGIMQLGADTLNPVLSARRLRLFNDHFDPIVWLAAPWVRLAPPYSGIIFESVVLWVATLPLWAMVRRRTLPQRSAQLLSGLILFNVGTVAAAYFPIHPTTWAAAAWVCLVVALAGDRYAHATAAFVLLMACKEEFPFVGLPLFAVLWRRKQRRWAAGVVLATGAWLLAAFGIRPWLLGPVLPYARMPFAGLMADPIAFARERLIADRMVISLVLFALPLAPCVLWLWRHGAWKSGRAYAFLCLPPWALRFAGMSWGYHYHAVTMAGLTLVLLPSLQARAPPRWLVLTTWLTLGGVNAIAATDAAGLLQASLGRTTPWCPADAARLTSIYRGEKLLRDNAHGAALVGCNLLPQLVDRPQTFLLNGPAPRYTGPFAWVMLEKPPYGMAWPSSNAQVAEHIALWRSLPGTHVFIDDAFLFVARGEFFQQINPG